MRERSGVNFRMPRTVVRAFAAPTILLFAVISSPAGAERTVFTVASGSEVWLRGETNITDWQCHGERIAGALDLAASHDELEEFISQLEALAHGNKDGPHKVTLPRSAPSLAPTLRLEIPIASLDCGRRAMERDLQDALSADEFPLIVLELDSVHEALLFRGSPEDPVCYLLRLDADLELAGTRRPVELTVTGMRDGLDRARFYTSLSLTMNDFGVQPPVALFGLIHARDELTVAVHLVLAPARTSG